MKGESAITPTTKKLYNSWWTAYTKLRDSLIAESQKPRPEARRFQTGALAEALAVELGEDKKLHKEAFFFALATARGFSSEHRLSLTFITDSTRLRFLEVAKVIKTARLRDFCDWIARLRDFCDWIEAEVSWGSSGSAQKVELLRSKPLESQAHDQAAELLAGLPSVDDFGRGFFIDFLFGATIGKRTARGYLADSGVVTNGVVNHGKWAQILATAASKAKTGEALEIEKQAIWIAFPIFKQTRWTNPQIETAVREIFPAGSPKQAESFSQAMRRMGLRTNVSRAANEPPFLRDLAIEIMRQEKKATRAPMGVFIWKPPSPKQA